MAFVYNARGDLARRDMYLGALAADTSAESALRLAEFNGYLGDRVESRGWLLRALQLKSREMSGQSYDNYLHLLKYSPFLADSVDDSLLAEVEERSEV